MPSRNRLGDDRPRRRKARRKETGSATPWVLGILAAVLLGCGGFAALIFFVVIAPKMEMARRVDQDNKEYEANAKVSKTKLNQLRAGMTKTEVEAILGPGRLAEWPDVMGTTGAFHNMEEMDKRWHPAREQKRVYVWDEYSDRILVGFSKDPNAGGTVVGIAGKIDTSRTYIETVRLP